MSRESAQFAAALIGAEMGRYRASRKASDMAAAWLALERAHILAQPYFVAHLASHWHMLGFALAVHDWREAAGQLFRLALVPLGSLTDRLPAGNTGRAGVSAFRPMPMPADLAEQLSLRDSAARH